MIRILYILFLLSISTWTYGQFEYSIGGYGGVAMSFTHDQGLQKDPRFKSKITFRGSPAGVFFGYSRLNIGFQAGIFYQQLGQQYGVFNIHNGEVGKRTIEMHYVGIPIGIKMLLMNISFFRLSVLGGLKVSYLVKGAESLTISSSTLVYPKGVLIPTDQGYTKLPDGGVMTPHVKNVVHVSHDKFNPIQLFVYLGFGTEYKIAEEWYLNLNLKGGYGILDSRKSGYINQLKKTEDAPDLYGVRHDFYVALELGISRVITFDKEVKIAHSNKKLKRYEPKSWAATGRAIRDNKTQRKGTYKSKSNKSKRKFKK